MTVHETIKRINCGENIRDMKLRVVDYARVSTACAAQRSSFNNQLDTYRDMIMSNPNWSYVGTYSDEGITGTKIELRGGFKQMLEDAKHDRFDLVIVKSVSRFARNLKECLVAKDELKAAGVMVSFEEEHINSFNESDELQLKFIALGADMEASFAKERTKIVFRQGIQKHRVYGNSKILGYKKSGCTLAVDEGEAAVVRRIFSLYVHEGLGYRRIAARLAEENLTRSDGAEIPTRTIQTVLENPKYKGFYCGGKTAVIDKGKYKKSQLLDESEWLCEKDESIPAIVSEELWDKAENIRRAKSQKFAENVAQPINRGIYKYSGKITHEACPSINYTHAKYKSREAWQLRNYKDILDSKSAVPTLYTDEIDEMIRLALDDFIGDYAKIAADLISLYRESASLNDVAAQVKKARVDMDKLVKKKKAAIELYEDELITKSEFAQRSAELSDKINACKQKLLQLKNTANGKEKTAQSFENLNRKALLFAKSMPPQKELIDAFIARITVNTASTKAVIHLAITTKFATHPHLFTITRKP